MNNQVGFIGKDGQQKWRWKVRIRMIFKMPKVG